MEWELSLCLTTDNVSINHKDIFSRVRKRQKQEQGHCGQRRVQVSVLEGQKGEWEVE